MFFGFLLYLGRRIWYFFFGFFILKYGVGEDRVVMFLGVGAEQVLEVGSRCGSRSLVFVLSCNFGLGLWWFRDFGDSLVFFELGFQYFVVVQVFDLFFWFLDQNIQFFRLISLLFRKVQVFFVIVRGFGFFLFKE